MSADTIDKSQLVVSIISEVGGYVRLPELASRKIESLDLEKASKEENFGYVLAIAIAITLPMRTYPGIGIRGALEIILKHNLSKRLQILVRQMKDSMHYQHTILNDILIQSGFFSKEEEALIERSYTDETLIQILFGIAREAIHKKI